MVQSPGVGVHLAIDTDVVCAMGERQPRGNPRPRRCRVFLEHVKDWGYRVAYTARLRQEWDQRAGGNAHFMTWRTYMVSKSRVVKVEGNPEVCREVENACQDRRLVQPTEIGEVMKDLPLVESALATGGRIASLDDSARSA